MDVRLIPMLALLYLLSFLDRGNIGNAKIEGLQEDLGMTPDQYNWCLTAFFFTYAAFEVPSNLLLKKLRPSRWLPSIMVAVWGNPFFSSPAPLDSIHGNKMNSMPLWGNRIHLSRSRIRLFGGYYYSAG